MLKNRTFLFGLFLYLIGLVVYTVYVYNSYKKEYMLEIDTRLKETAKALEYVIGSDFHDRELTPELLTNVQDRALMERLTRFNESMGTKFVYTLIKRGNTIYFTSSSLTKEEEADNTTFYYYLPYEDANPEDFAAFKHGDKPLFFEAVDHWGHFRSIRIKKTTPHGYTYLLGADVLMSTVEKKVMYSVLKALATALFFLILIIPPFLLYIRAIKRQQVLDAATKAKSEFLASMSHEIRTPMNAILGFVEQLAKDEKVPERQKQFAIIKNSGDSLLSIINDILDFSKIESGKMDFESHPYHLHKLFQNSIDVFSNLAQEKQIELNIILDAALPKCAIGDQVRLKQIVFNLVSNALKFTDAGGKVTIEVRPIQYINSILVSVRDTGKGIAKENLEKIFDAFSQEDTSTTRKFGGTGLGLTISSKLIHMMGGELKVQSRIDQGSRFYFTIPILSCQEDMLPKEDGENFIDNIRAFQGHLLVVEDNKTNQVLISIILDKFELTYDIANDGIEAVELFKHNSYDLILMDENMPNMNGIEATHKISAIEQKRAQSHTPVIAVTANAMVEDKKRFIAAGMDAYLSKPYSEGDIIQLFSEYLIPVIGEEKEETDTDAEIIEPPLQNNHKEFLNMDEINKYIPMPPKILHKVLNTFLISVDIDMQQLKDAIDNGVLDEIAKAAHKLKGAVGNIRIYEIESFLKEIEMQSKNNEEIDYNAQYAVLEKMIIQLKSEINLEIN